MRPSNSREISPNEFASQVIAYTEQNPALALAGTQERNIPSHWTLTVEGDFPRFSCLVRHGLYDRVFQRGSVAPTRWDDFERSYRTADADIVERIYQECLGRGINGMFANVADIKEGMRNPFFTTGDFWTQKTQTRVLEAVIGQFGAKGWLTEPSRAYESDLDVIGVDIPGVTKFDLSTTFNGVRRMRDEIVRGERYTGDFPRVERYADKIPVCYLVADNAESFKDDIPYKKMINLVRENTNPTPELQNITYVMGDKEKNNRSVIPRYVGSMSAFMLEYAYGSPAGTRLYDHDYLVPQYDMNEEELEHLENDSINWELHHSRIMSNHPQIFS